MCIRDSYQARKRWKNGAASAREAIRADSSFVKGHAHLAKCLVQLGLAKDAREAVQAGIRVVDADKVAILERLLAEIGQQSTVKPAAGSNDAEGLKEQGNQCYKCADYSGAIRFYTQAISAAPKVGVYFGNRAACWMMLKQYERVVKDCSAGLALEQAGELAKLRLRMANALMMLNKVDRAADVLQEGVSRGGQHLKALQDQLGQIQALLGLQAKGNRALEHKDWSGAKFHFSKLVSTVGLEEHTGWRLGLAQALQGNAELSEAALLAQKVIADLPDCAPAYQIRADCLQRMGLVDKAVQTISALLQRDPENPEVSGQLKRIRYLQSQIKHITQELEAAFKSRDFDTAIRLSSEGATLDPDNVDLTASMLLSRAKARHQLAKAHASKSKDPDAAAKANALWRKSLHDTQTASYHAENLLEPFLLRAEILQGLERWEEAVLEIKDAIGRGPGAQSTEAHNKLMQAEFLVRKSKRVDYYALLGVEFGVKASEREIRAGYKQQAMLYHPDKQAGMDDKDKEQATSKFKLLGEALEVLTDPYMRKLWDQGHDLESIKQHVELQKQQQKQ
eukprot:TRINITY_DN24072_c0_g1_i1.p1 TRINITY_DN24072_c0_g1~~TRINITY_DN24072_c0_g1_i1.p1  ORF type:complete len:565 (+),score=133.42 TRINITY_DN24072_c0_g1_i1:147-1841(+)